MNRLPNNILRYCIDPLLNDREATYCWRTNKNTVKLLKERIYIDEHSVFIEGHKITKFKITKDSFDFIPYKNPYKQKKKMVFLTDVIADEISVNNAILYNHLLVLLNKIKDYKITSINFDLQLSNFTQDQFIELSLLLPKTLTSVIAIDLPVVNLFPFPPTVTCLEFSGIYDGLFQKITNVNPIHTLILQKFDLWVTAALPLPENITILHIKDFIIPPIYHCPLVYLSKHLQYVKIYKVTNKLQRRLKIYKNWNTNVEYLGSTHISIINTTE